MLSDACYLSGKQGNCMNIVLTGASRGIGFDVALALAADKSNQIIAIARSNDGLNQLKKTASENNLFIDTYVQDLTTIDTTFFDTILAKYTVIDVLINNAAILKNKPFLETTPQDWNDVFATNVFGTANLIRNIVPALQKSPVAHIVNIGSMGGFQGSGKFKGLSAYSASKAALANLTECLAEELLPLGIKVNCLALGSVNTEMLQKAFPSYQAPLSSKQMADFIAHFAQYSHAYFNGKILPVSVSTP